MLKYVHFHTRFEKRLDALKHSEKMAVAAARKAEDIIYAILNEGDAPLTKKGKIARHGEARIKNCIKFDIGKGHRLVCVKDKEHIYLLFVGTHDDCYAWIENNRNYKPDPKAINLITRPILKQQNVNTQLIEEALNEADYEDLLLEKITDKDLKHIFRGLVGFGVSQPH